jgi:hypothetical protein
VLLGLADLAHGISPAVLTEAGIGPALWTVADSAPLPVEVGEAPDERFPQAVERTAFVVATEAIDAAHRRRSGHVAIRVFREDDRLIVEAEGADPVHSSTWPTGWAPWAGMSPAAGNCCGR